MEALERAFISAPSWINKARSPLVPCRLLLWTSGAKPQKPGALTQLRGAAPPSASVRLRGSTAPLRCRDSACRDAGVGVGGCRWGLRGGEDGWAEVEDFHYKITYLLCRFLLPPLYSNRTGGPLSFVHTLPPHPPGSGQSRAHRRASALTATYRSARPKLSQAAAGCVHTHTHTLAGQPQMFPGRLSRPGVCWIGSRHVGGNRSSAPNNLPDSQPQLETLRLFF